MESSEPSTSTPAAPPGDGAVLRIDRLAKRYGSFEAVRSLTLQVNRGESVALLGPNGAGKTTTIRMVMGILQPSEGSATVHGHDCFAARAQVMRHVGYLPDEPVFYDYLRGGEIVRFVGEMHGLTAAEAERRAAPLIERIELDDARDEYAVNYSKGMKKKLALVCATLHEPSLLLLDEPTNGLDPFATRTFQSWIREQVARGTAVFFSTHLLDQAERICERVGILYKGGLAAFGLLDELKKGLREGGSLEDVFFQVAAESAAGPRHADRPPGASDA
jgi:ABC-2 type transport system ATP-binding protein